MISTQYMVGGLVSRQKPGAYSDDPGTDRPFRTGRYGEAYQIPLLSSKYGLADEGSYFVAFNPTIDTGVAYDLIVAYAATTVAFACYNGGGRRVYLDRLKLYMTGTAPATHTVNKLVVTTDSADRTPTAGSPATATSYNVNSDDNTTAGFIVQHCTGGAAITVPAAGANRRIVCKSSMPTSAAVLGDEYVWDFGSDVIPSAGGELTAVRATAPARFVDDCGPVIVAPAHWCLFHLYFITDTTNKATFEFELSWWER